MKVRFGLLLATSTLVVAGACASGGGGGGASPSEEGYEPQNDQYTTAAQLSLSQAQSAEDEAVAQERYRAALEAANEGIQNDTLNPLAYYQAGLSLVMLDENYERADSLLTTAVELYPAFETDVTPVREQAWINLYNRAIEPLNQGNMDEAIRLFDQANQMFADRPEAYLNLGSIYAQQNQPEQAADAFREAAEAADRYAELLSQMETVPEAQLEQVRQSESLAIQNLGQTLVTLERYEEAGEVYREYLEANPDDVQTLSTYAAVLSRAGMPDSAAVIYDDLLNRPGLNSVDYVAVGVGLYQGENWEGAAEAFRNALDLNPRHREAAFNLVQAHLAAEMWEPLVDATETALELDPRTGDFYRIRARALAETGDQAAAGRVLDEYQSLTFEVTQLQMTRSGSGATVNGQLTNNSVQQGEPIVLRVHFNDPDGNEIGTDEVTIPAPAAEGMSQFEARVSSGDEVGGYWYEVVRPQ